MILVCYSISQDHLIKGSCDFTGVKSRQVIILPSLVAKALWYGYVMAFVCHVTLQDHLIKGSCDFMSRCPSRLVPILPSLVIGDDRNRWLWVVLDRKSLHKYSVNAEVT